ncbi:hypothetical protein [uncultured Rubinisphaera sp.]|uniref:hypothetical protein n=1 Tax=uncultured Rubinisphaera sp. TaxID=1678686 RepID=UPI0030D994E0|tara:strand:- start:165 stop:503 length:339 start_codon:yes stop_codon:yes gene_type:complete
MGSVELTCRCGFTFLNSTDNRSYIAHWIADQDLDQFWELIDNAIEKSGPTAREKEAACMNLRRHLLSARQTIWQCPECGLVYLFDAEGKPHGFPPEGDSPRNLLKSQKPNTN